MNIFPNNLPEQLDFNYIIEKVAEFCFGKNAKEKAFILKPKTSLFHIEKELAETNEVLMSLLKNDSFKHTKLFKIRTYYKIFTHLILHF